MRSHYAQRRGAEWTLAELVVVALAYLDGDAVSSIASRLRRTVTEVRVVLSGAVA